MHPELKEIKDQKYYIEFLLQESYVHLGDIYRYTASADAPKLRSTYLGQALIYYKEASNIDKSKGQPYNQMAILFCSKAEFFHVILYWCKALDARQPFSPSATNLTQQLEKCLGRPALNVAESLMKNSNNPPNKKIEDAKKYFMRCFARAYLKSEKKLDHILDLSDFIQVNKLFSQVTIRSKNLGWFYLKVSYLYIWLYCCKNVENLPQMKDYLLEAIFDFTQIMLGANHESDNIPKRSPLEINRLMPAVRLTVEWLHKNEKTDAVKRLAMRYFHRFDNAENKNLYQDKLNIALSEGEEISGMNSFERVHKTLLYQSYFWGVYE